MKWSRSSALLLALPWILTFLLFWLFPILYSFIIGFTDQQLLVKEYQWIGLDNYRALLSDPAFIESLKNTLITAMVVIALVFTNLYQRGGYIALLASMVGLSPPEHGLLFDSGTALYSIMAMDVWMAVGYYMLIFLAGLKSIPEELYEAAALSGAGAIRRFFSITLPMLKPVVLFILVINSIKSFQVFVEIFVMTRGKFETSTMVYFVYETGLTTRFQFGYASAAAYVLFLIIALFSVLQFILLRRRQALW